MNTNDHESRRFSDKIAARHEALGDHYHEVCKHADVTPCPVLWVSASFDTQPLALVFIDGHFDGGAIEVHAGSDDMLVYRCLGETTKARARNSRN